MDAAHVGLCVGNYFREEVGEGRAGEFGVAGAVEVAVVDGFPGGRVAEAGGGLLLLLGLGMGALLLLLVLGGALGAEVGVVWSVVLLRVGRGGSGWGGEVLRVRIAGGGCEFGGRVVGCCGLGGMVGHSACKQFDENLVSRSIDCMWYGG